MLVQSRRINMEQVFFSRVLFLLVISFLSRADGEDPKVVTNQASSAPALSTSFPPASAAEWQKNSKLTDGKRYILPIPSDLTGASDADLMKYAKLLYKRERRIHTKVTIHLAFSAFSALLTYVFRHSIIFLPVIAFIEGQNQGFRKTLDADWMVYQEQLADYVVEYMRLKKIDPKALPVSKVLGVPLINLKCDSKKMVEFPVWRTEKDHPLPTEAGLRQMGSMLKNWWKM